MREVLKTKDKKESVDKKSEVLEAFHFLKEDIGVYYQHSPDHDLTHLFLT